MWPLAAGAQKPERMRRVGVLMSADEDDPLMQARVGAFRQALEELRWAEGRNLKIEWRWTGGDITRVREYASELVQLAPDVIVANGTPNVAALKQATNSIPIVFVVVNDPVAQGKFEWTGGTGKHDVKGPGTYTCNFTQSGGGCDWQGEAEFSGM
jgi:ABC-type uncharacterized transport system substrate-binding protein